MKDHLLAFKDNVAKPLQHTISFIKDKAKHIQHVHTL